MIGWRVFASLFYYICDMEHFKLSKNPSASRREVLREGVLPICGIIGITSILVGVFALCLYLGGNMEPVIPIHMDDGEMVDPNPMRLAFMLTAFVLAFVLAYVADRKGRQGETMPAFWLGYAAGTLLWQSVGECAWHFSIQEDEFLMCFPHIEGASAIFLVILTTILLVYCYRRKAFTWGVWVFFLSFVGNWFGHFVLIGTYPIVHEIMEEQVWFKGAGAILGMLTCIGALLLSIFSARDKKARLCCCLLLYFGIGIIVTGVCGL